MNLETYDWSKFEINYYYPLSVEKLFTAWTTASGLKSFFIEQIKIVGQDKYLRAEQEQIQNQDKYSWIWRHNYSLEGVFKEVVQNQRIEFSFGSMNVALEFQQLSDSTLLRLLQTDIPLTDEAKSTSHMNCRICWTFFLTNLKSVLCHGVDLRDQNPERASSFEVGYRPRETHL